MVSSKYIKVKFRVNFEEEVPPNLGSSIVADVNERFYILGLENTCGN